MHRRLRGRAAHATAGATVRRLARSNLVRKGLLLGGANVIARALGFAYAAVLPWVLNQDQYGFTRYVIATATLLGQVVFSGYPTAIARFVGKHEGEPDRQSSYLSNGVCANALLGLVVMLFGAVALRPANGLDWEVAVVLIGLGVDYTFVAVLRGLLRAKLLAAYAISSKALQIVLVAACVVMGRPLSAVDALLVYSLANLPSLLLIAALGSLGIRLKASAVSRGTLWEVTRFTVPLLANAAAYGVLMGFDSYLVRSYHGLEAVAVYNAARTLTLVFSFAPYAINTVLMPRMAQLGTLEASERHLGFSLGVCAVVCGILLVVFLLLSGSIVSLLLPPEYSGASGIVVVLAVGSAFFYVYSVLSQAWTGLGRPGVPAMLLTLAAVTDVVFNMWLAPTGVLGAAASYTMASLLALAGLVYYTVRQERHRIVTSSRALTG